MIKKIYQMDGSNMHATVHARYAILEKLWVMNELGMKNSLVATFIPDGYFSSSK
jgi:hypothetical protein